MGASRGMAGKVVVFLLVGCSSAQVWDKELCRTRESHWTHNNHGYLYSGRSDLLAAEEKITTKTGAGEANITAVTRDWAGAGDWCQKRCMDLVSLETEQEWEKVRDKMEEFRAPFIWTSGHICDREVGTRCFTDPTLQPRLVNGWFWSGSGAQIPPTNLWQSDTVWNDIACYHQKEWVCEDSDKMLK